MKGAENREYQGGTPSHPTAFVLKRRKSVWTAMAEGHVVGGGMQVDRIGGDEYSESVETEA